MAAVLVAGAAYAAVQLTTPTHPVPQLVGAPLDRAQTVVNEFNFDLDVSRRFDETAAAGIVLSQDPPPGKELKEQKSIKVVVSDGAAPRPVPSLANMAEAAAVEALKAAGFQANVVQAASETVPKGTVVTWTPQGTQAKGTTVTVTVSNGPPVVPIPAVEGMTYDAAAKALTDLGFVPQRKDEYSDDVPDAGKVIGTSPTGSAAKGTKVTVTVSKGPKTVKVPDVRGMKLAQARAALAAAGLKPGQVYGPNGADKVIDTSPERGGRGAARHHRRHLRQALVT